jgi:hypothetical protein
MEDCRIGCVCQLLACSGQPPAEFNITARLQIHSECSIAIKQISPQEEIGGGTILTDLDVFLLVQVQTSVEILNSIGTTVLELHLYVTRDKCRLFLSQSPNAILEPVGRGPAVGIGEGDNLAMRMLNAPITRCIGALDLVFDQ